VTWNVRSLRDDPRGVAAALRELAPDLVCVQEAPRLWRWRSARRRLARRAGLRLLTRDRACGTLLLGSSRVRVHGAGTVRLPRRPGLHRRAAVHARVEVAGHVLVVACTHLDLDPQARLDSARRVRAALPAGPLVLGADVNDEPGSPGWSALAAGLVDAGEGLGPTFSVAAPRRRIDALLVDPVLLVLARRVVDAGPVTDHRAVCADLAWPPGPEAPAAP